MPALAASPRKDDINRNDEPLSRIEELITRFRQLFPKTSRRALTEEFTKLVNCIHFDNPSKKRTPLSPLEFKLAVAKSKPDSHGKFTDEEFNLLFDYFNVEGDRKIALYEFVKGIRVSSTLSIASFLFISVFDYLYHRFTRKPNNLSFFI